MGAGVNKNHPRAIEYWEEAADEDLSKAQFNLGIAYDKGEVVAQDYAKAFRWYRKAAEQGFAKAQFNLGFAYSNGEGVEKDATEADEVVSPKPPSRDTPRRKSFWVSPIATARALRRTPPRRRSGIAKAAEQGISRGASHSGCRLSQRRGR